MKILGIETSCDETAAAVLDIEKNKIWVLSNVVSSQVKIHAKYGGVVPHLAAREHEKNLPHVLNTALKSAKIKSIRNIDLITVTVGPGLSPALWRGVNFAKDMAKKYKKPLTGVSHLEGHIYSNWLKPIREFSIFKKTFPALNLIVSGGHTLLVLMKGYGKYKLIGETRDDAAGEAFDKIARLLGLGYPGGPAIAIRADQFKIQSASRRTKLKIELPRPMINSKDYDFSFSGLKTAVLYKLRDLKEKKVKLTASLINQICHEVQQAVIDVLIKKTTFAAKEYKVKLIMLSGGVSANRALRAALEKATGDLGIIYFQPPLEYTTDNAAMVALVGYFNSKNKKTGLKSVNVNANLIF